MRLHVGYISLLLLVTGSQATTTDTATDTATDKVAEFVDPVLRVNKVTDTSESIGVEDAAPSTASVVILVAVVAILSGVLHRDIVVGTASSPVKASDVATPARIVAETEVVALMVTTAC
ncbi:hypothetical protein APHAL10511_002905 [Amanita phalloides]|nr:hypothetical protein APHAL10511_002905 [Amanita phalloides]